MHLNRNGLTLAGAMTALALSACVPAIPVPPAVQLAARGTAQWQVEPGDIVRLRIWQNTDQSGDLPVNERGEVLVPTLGRINVSGMTPAAIESRILRGYSGRIDSTRIEVTYLRPVSVVGGVRTPGVQLADPSTSVLSLVTRAGGPQRVGGDLRVFLLRIAEPVHEVSTADRVSDLGIRSTDQLYVQDPPFVVRNEVAVRSVFEVLQIVSTIVTIVLVARR